MMGPPDAKRFATGHTPGCPQEQENAGSRAQQHEHQHGNPERCLRIALTGQNVGIADRLVSQPEGNAQSEYSE